MRGVEKEIRKGGRSKRVPEGDYLLKIVEGTWMDGDEFDYIRWRFQIAKGKHKGGTLYCNTSLNPKSLWNLRNLIFAGLGKNMAGKAFKFDPAKLEGKIVGSTVADDEYAKKGSTVIRSQPVDFFPKDKFEESEEEEEEADDDADEEEEETEEEETDDEEEELEDVDVEEL